MKVAIIHHQYAKKGGMESYLFDMIRGFGEQGDDLTVITYRQDQHVPLYPHCTVKLHKMLLPRLLPQIYQKFCFMHYINQSFAKSQYDLSISFMRTASQDVVICGGTHRGYLYSMQQRAKLRDQIEIYLEQKSYQKTPRIVAHSNLLKNEIINLYGIDAAKIAMIFPPLDTQIFNASIRERRAQHQAKFGINSHKTTLLFPSTGHKRKGWFELLEALRLLPQDEFELVVAGNQKAIKNQPTNLKQLGFVADMPALYAAVDFVILPSYYEPFGLVVSESLQCGTPVIISDKVGAKDLVTENEGIILEAITPAAIAQAILTARDRQFNIAPNFAESHGLTIKEHINKIKNILKKLRIKN